jgi:hypothetical protein
MEDKTKEKALMEEMKKTYGIERVSHKIIINWISDTTTKMATKLIPCKLLRKFHKEEVLTGVFVATVQCTNDMMLSWVPYLLNLFLYEYKDA